MTYLESSWLQPYISELMEVQQHDDMGGGESICHDKPLQGLILGACITKLRSELSIMLYS